MLLYLLPFWLDNDVEILHICWILPPRWVSPQRGGEAQNLSSLQVCVHPLVPPGQSLVLRGINPSQKCQQHQDSSFESRGIQTRALCNLVHVGICGFGRDLTLAMSEALGLLDQRLGERIQGCFTDKVFIFAADGAWILLIEQQSNKPVIFPVCSSQAERKITLSSASDVSEKRCFSFKTACAQG